MKILKTYGADASAADSVIQQLEERGAINTAKVDVVVREILSAVRQRGDARVREFATDFDGLTDDQPFLVGRAEMQAAWDSISEQLKAAMRLAQANIRAFAEKQLPRAWSFRPAEGMEVGQIVRPLGSVGCYVPGGRYPLPSTLLMTVTPAQVAGVERIVVCSPKPARETMAAAYLSGITEFYRIGGAQAIAALAYGTETIAAVDKIVGPGNLYVTAAKMAVSHHTGVDMIAGPSEVVVLADKSADPPFVAADLLAQAEHDEAAQSILITDDTGLARAVEAEVERQLESLPRAKIAGASWRDNGAIILCQSLDAAIPLVDRLAPEHLEIMAHDSEALSDRIANAGAIFLGAHTPEAIGDYVGGSNHVLPTARSARFSSGLGVLDFMKRP